MRLDPLILSVSHAGIVDRGDACPSCGARAAGRQVHFVSEVQSDEFADEPDWSCPLCHLVRHLERDTIDEEGVLIWLPELSQLALNAIVREAHTRFAAVGLLSLASMPCGGRSHADRDVRGAAEGLCAFDACASHAATLLGSPSPALLGRALSRLSPQDYADRAKRLGGLRLLARGRFFVDGADVYPRFFPLQSPEH